MNGKGVESVVSNFLNLVILDSCCYCVTFQCRVTLVFGCELAIEAQNMVAAVLLVTKSENLFSVQI